MGKRLAATMGVALMALLLPAAPSAIGATEVGNTCVANDNQPNWTALSLSREGNPIPLTMPSAGVVTGWRVAIKGRPPLEQRLRIYRETTAPNEFLTVSESATEQVVDGVNSFATRIPVQAGDRVGLYGPVETYFCDNESENSSAVFSGEAPAGTTQTFKVESVGAPVIAIVEPDADGDGFGDETQDRCPQSAIFQECPIVRLSGSAHPATRFILVRVQANSEARVTVFGRVGWRLRQGAQGAARAKGPKKRIVPLAGGTKTILTGVSTRFKVPLPKSVLRKLGRMTPKQTLRAKVTARAVDISGQVTRRTFKVRLPGHRGLRP